VESFVALGLSVLVVGGGWDDFGDAVCAHAHVPALVLGGSISMRVGFDEPVVRGAEQGAVVEAGGPHGGPGSDVVGVAVARVAVAAGEHASAVSQHDGLPEVAGEESGGAAEVEDL
jgi:hypothetical protein